MSARAQRRRSFGSVADLGKDLDGKTRWRLRYTEDGVRKTEMVHGTRREAEHRLAELHAASDVRRQSLMTLDAAADRWLWPRVDEDASASTRRVYRSVWHRHVSPAWGSRPIAAIKPLDVQDWLMTLPGSAARFARILMSQTVDRAVMYGVVASNPLDVDYRLPKAEERPKDAYSAADLVRVCRAVEGTLAEAPVVLMAFGGLRVSESLGVMPGDVSEHVAQNGVRLALIAVERQASRECGVTETLKTPQSRRTAVVFGPFVDRLLELRDAVSARGERFLADDGLGTPVESRFVSYYMRLRVEAAGMPCHQLRALRRSWETMAHWELGLGPEEVEPLMGHAGKTVTARHYDRPSPEALAEAVARAYASNWSVKDI